MSKKLSKIVSIMLSLILIASVCIFQMPISAHAADVLTLTALTDQTSYTSSATSLTVDVYLSKGIDAVNSAGINAYSYKLSYDSTVFNAPTFSTDKAEYKGAGNNGTLACDTAVDGVVTVTGGDISGDSPLLDSSAALVDDDNKINLGTLTFTFKTTPATAGDHSFSFDTAEASTFFDFVADGFKVYSGASDSLVLANASITVDAAETTNTVTYVLDGGTNDPSNPASYTYGTAVALAAATKAGYIFDGWYSEATGGTKVTEISATDTGAKTFYARWTAQSQTITYNANGGSGTMTNQTDITDAEVTLKKNIFTKENYVFDGWATSAGGAKVYSDEQKIKMPAGGINLYAVWTRYYTVTFVDAYDGAILETQTVREGSAAIAPTPPTHDGRVFVSWDTDFSNVTSDLNVTALYDITHYTVTWLNWDGTVFHTEEVMESYTPQGPPTDPTRDGYIFEGWDKSLSEVYEDITISPMFAELPKYTVTFIDGVTSNVIETQPVLEGESAVAPTPPSHDGFVFVSWDKDFSKVMSDMTVTALYDPDIYILHTVRFVDWDGRVIKTEEVPQNASPTPPEDPVRVGYTFTGWDNFGAPIEGDTTITATYTEKYFTVEFSDYDGTYLDTVQVQEGTSAAAPTPLGREGYDFVGWSQDISIVMGDMSVTATYTIKKYTVTFICNLFGEYLGTVMVDYGSEPQVLDTHIHEGYLFNGWSSEVLNENGDMNYYANYVIENYTVNFVDMDGIKVLSTETYEYGILINEFTAPPKTGFTFEGWYADSALTIPWDFNNNKAAGDTTIYSKWTAASEQVLTYDCNGATSGTMTDSTATTGEEVTLKKNSFTRDGYNFGGWATSAGGTVAYTDEQKITMPDGGLVLYAVWTTNTYTVTAAIQGSSSTGEGVTIKAYAASDTSFTTVIDSAVVAADRMVTFTKLDQSTSYVFVMKPDKCLSIKISGSFTSLGGILDFTNGGTLQFFKGDMNNDDIISVTDLSAFYSAYSSASMTADLNEDSSVSVQDLAILAVNYGKSGNA